jgi:Holliday junction resolvase RusA-like endonuclease
VFVCDVAHGVTIAQLIVASKYHLPNNYKIMVTFSAIDLVQYLVHTSSMKPVYLVVKGEPASKANSRRLVQRGGKPMFIKSAKALSYAELFAYQVKPLPQMIEGEVRLDIWIYYSTQRPDLDESLILDLLQGKVYANDRQVRERHVYHFIDKYDPRVVILAQPRDKAANEELLEAARREWG